MPRGVSAFTAQCTSVPRGRHNTAMSDIEIEPADPRLRRRAIIALVAAGLIGATGIAMLQQWLDELARGRDATDPGTLGLMATALALTIGIACASLLVLGFYLWRLGTRVHASMRFPPPGMRVLRDTPVVRGADASRRARMLQILAGVLLLCAAGLTLATWRLRALLI